MARSVDESIGVGLVGADAFRARWAALVAAHAERTAVIVGSRALTFAALDAASGAAAERLRSIGGWSEGTIVELETDGTEYLIRAIAVWRAGGAVLPMQRAMLDADASLARLVEALGEVVWRTAASAPEVRRRHDRRPVVDGLHSVHFTSGSTGTPRAVARGWRQALFEADRYRSLLGIGPEHRCTMLVAPAFGASTKHLLGTLLAGASQRISTAETLEPDQAEGHVLYATPGQVAACADRLAALGQRQAAGFAWISMTGEALTAGGWRGARLLAAPGARLLDALGGTEFGVAANSTAAIAPLHEGIVEPPPFRGMAPEGKELVIVDDEGTPLPAGEPGRLLVACDAIAEGYIDLPDGTPTLVPFASPPGRASGAVRAALTGDIAERLPDGGIRVLGRAGSMLKRHGRWLDSAPLREALAADGRVRTFAVDVAGASSQLRLWIEPERFDEIEIGAIAATLERTLRDSPVLPSEIVAVRSLPRNRHGKLDLATLRSADPRSFDAIIHRPRGRIAAIAEEILRATAGDSSDAPASLRDHGLESLEVVELLLELGRRLGRTVHIDEILAEVPLHRLRERLLDGSPTQGSPCAALGVADAPTLLLWFGEGVGSIVAAVGLDCRILHWDCDRGLEPGFGSAAKGVTGLADELIASLGTRLDAERLVVAGYSYGALVAAACAARLEARGRTVEALHLVDPARLRNGLPRDLWRTARSIALLGLAGAGLLGKAARESDAEEHRRLRVATRRLTMARFRPSLLQCEVLLHTSPSHHAEACRTFARIARQVRLSPTDAESHNAIVRDRRHVERWLAPLVEAVRGGSARAGVRT